MKLLPTQRYLLKIQQIPHPNQASSRVPPAGHIGVRIRRALTIAQTLRLARRHVRALYQSKPIRQFHPLRSKKPVPRIATQTPPPRAPPGPVPCIPRCPVLRLEPTEALTYRHRTAAIADPVRPAPVVNIARLARPRPYHSPILQCLQPNHHLD
ncbi:hypothetical protein QJS10_CPB11g01097 [Acorus calamus]|uniref:Uncharacterized protein n=1 Tax=Acorus calamus TaxID=4465 RepID=A0AAV9DSC2_ACOCL|nr:hypothetical protein QJS10_CPB11g01097 [Acorus calamus]